MRPDELFSILRPELTTSELAKLNEAPWWYNPLVLECEFWIAALVLTALLLWTRPAFFQKLEAYGKSLSRKRGLVVAGVILAALLFRLPLLVVMPYPEPVVHDEYSYLLQAATFASGRLTNPTPAGWEHFESFHINMRPTYQSMYPPGQATFLAAAEVLHLHPWWGVWFSVALMCGAVCWMLQGWLPPQWALLGGAFCVFRFSTFSYWMNTYWGGAVAAMGGALLLGSLPRLQRHPKVRYGLLFALGLAVLANTRPYEGFIFSLPAIVALMVWLIPAWKRGEVRVAILAPAALLLVVVVMAMGYYNWRSTGNPMFMAYMANHQQYHITKPFIWQTRLPIHEYRHPVMRTFYIFHELPDYLNRANPDGYTNLIEQRVRVYYEFFVWPLMIPGVFAMWIMMKSRKMRVLAITLLFMLAGLVIEQWPPHDHYAAPILAVTVLVSLYALRLMWTIQPRGIPLGPMMVRSIAMVIMALSLLAMGETSLNPFRVVEEAKIVSPQLVRASLVSRLQKTAGNHLVFVHLHYWDRGSIFWIYNDPDLSKSKIIWAYDMGDAENGELVKLYPNRNVWFIDKDDVIDALVPYPGITEVAQQSKLESSSQTHAQ